MLCTVEVYILQFLGSGFIVWISDLLGIIPWLCLGPYNHPSFLVNCSSYFWLSGTRQSLAPGSTFPITWNFLPEVSFKIGEHPLPWLFAMAIPYGRYIFFFFFIGISLPIFIKFVLLVMLLVSLTTLSKHVCVFIDV